MTREEAIAELSVLHERLSNPRDCEDGCYSWEDGEYVEAIDIAIEALQDGWIPVTLCKNCQYSQIIKSTRATYCLWWQSRVKPDGWCFKGEEEKK